MNVMMVLLQCDMIKFLVKAKEMGGHEEVGLPHAPYWTSQGTVKHVTWNFQDTAKGMEFYEWGIKNNSYH